MTAYSNSGSKKSDNKISPRPTQSTLANKVIVVQVANIDWISGCFLALEIRSKLRNFSN